jgi:hypothetical protein
MSTQPYSFVIRFLKGTYNRGCGFEVDSFHAATLYTTREKASLVASQLRGSPRVVELPISPCKRGDDVGPMWIAAEHPRPTEGQLATLQVVLADLRGDAVINHKLEGEATDPDAREEYAHNRFRKLAHAGVMLEMLKYFGVGGLPELLELPHHPPLKTSP